MIDSEILECSQAILCFIIDDSDPKMYNSFLDIPSLKNMNNILSKYNTDMVPFTIFINSKYKIYSEPLWDKSAREFFSTSKSEMLYKNVIRELKIKELLT